MVDDGANRRIIVTRAVLALIAAAWLFASFAGMSVQAQSIMRTPNLNVAPRLPRINPSVGARVNPTGITRVNPTITGKTVSIGKTTSFRSVPRIGVRSTLPYARYSPNLYPPCSDGYRDGGCWDQSGSSAGGGGGGASSAKSVNNIPRRDVSQAALNLHTVANELVAEIDGALSDARADELARHHGLVRLQSQNFPLIGATIGLFRIADRRAAETVSRELAADANVRSVQPNFRYVLQDQKAALTAGDPGQYAVAELRLPEAHKLADGANITIAVIDSGIDVKHPELANSIAESFDALGSKEGPHVHGTGVAGAIVAHARLMGSAPAARILAIRAFGKVSSGAESTSFVILKGMDYAAAHGAQIVNMSFAGPKDALIERGIAALAGKGIVMVAAAGNAGAKSPPLYPAANANVIAISATDAQDKLFTASNRGGYIAVAAPGVDVFLPAPEEKYQITSGTSFSAAYVSGLAGLMLERNPALKPEELRAILMKTARDLGSPGRDDLFGAGEADAFAAVSAVGAAPVAAMSGPPAGATGENVSDRQQVPATRALDGPAAAMASDKSAAGDPNRPAAQKFSSRKTPAKKR
jgi:subtilisin family serine protease